jgi:NADH-quinone oxidoreductase subunit N
MAAAGGLLIAAAQDLLVTFVGLELLSLGLYIMTAFAKSSGKSAEAALKYYLFGGMSAAFLLFGFSYIYGITGSTNFAQIYAVLSQPHTGLPPLFLVALVTIAAGLGFKVAAVPFHLWAPDTYEGAPAQSAAFIASVSKVASFALLVGIASVGLAGSNPANSTSGTRIEMGLAAALQSLFLNIFVTYLIFALALASMVLGNLAALAQISVRRLLAYSAIAHAGYILLGIGASSSRSSAAVLYYILTYGLTTIGAFGVVDVVQRATGSDKLFAAVLDVSAGPVPFTLVALAVAFSAVSLYYYLQVLKRAYVMPVAEGTPIKAHPVTMAVLLLIAAAVVLLGCFPAMLQNWIASFYPVQ